MIARSWTYVPEQLCSFNQLIDNRKGSREFPSPVQSFQLQTETFHNLVESEEDYDSKSDFLLFPRYDFVTDAVLAF